MNQFIFLKKTYLKKEPSSSLRPIALKMLAAIKEKNEPHFIKLYDQLYLELAKTMDKSLLKNTVNILPILQRLQAYGLKTSVEHVLKSHYPSYSQSDAPANRKTIINLTKFLINLRPKNSFTFLNEDVPTPPLNLNAPTTDGLALLDFFLKEHRLAPELLKSCYERMFATAVTHKCWTSVEYLLSPSFTPKIQNFTSSMYTFMIHIAIAGKMDLVETMASHLNKETRQDMIEELEKMKNKRYTPSTKIYSDTAHLLFNLFLAGFEKNKLLKEIPSAPLMPINAVSSQPAFKV